jgi:hypothetical protein
VIFTFVLSAWSVLGASFGPVIILGLLWKRTTRQGAIAGLLIGSIVSVMWNNVLGLSGALYEIVPAFVLSFAGVIVVSLMSQPSEKEARERGQEYELSIKRSGTRSRVGLARMDLVCSDSVKSPPAFLVDHPHQRHEDQEGGVLGWGRNRRSMWRRRVTRRHALRDIEPV